MPLCMECSVKPGETAGELIVEVSTKSAAYVVTAVIVSVFLITHPTDVELTPAVSPAMQCVMNLTIQYFTIYLVLMICTTVKQFMKDDHPAFVTKVVDVFEAAKDTVMFAPMLCMLYIGARMRALQLATSTDGTIPPTAGPQTWVQEAMFVSAWAVLVQLIMVIIVGFCVGEGKPVMDESGNVKVPSDTNKYIAYGLEAVRYLCLAAMYGGVVTIMVGIFLMTPESLPPYNNETLLPGGLEVPPPPTPPTAGGF